MTDDLEVTLLGRELPDRLLLFRNVMRDPQVHHALSSSALSEPYLDPYLAPYQRHVRPPGTPCHTAPIIQRPM